MAEELFDVNGDGVINELDGYTPEQLEVYKAKIELEKMKIELQRDQDRKDAQAAKVAEYKATDRVWKKGDKEDVSCPRFTAGWYNANMEVLVEASGTFTWVARR